MSPRVQIFFEGKFCIAGSKSQLWLANIVCRLHDSISQQEEYSSFSLFGDGGRHLYFFGFLVTRKFKNYLFIIY
jgi:hypothetical protein